MIGHRGAPAYLPEHTLASYALAIELGADCIEPDLVATRDGVLIARHEPNLRDTTDVAARPEFAARFRRERAVAGPPESGWFASDFSLAEIRSLRARQTLPEERFTGLDGRLSIPTLEEVLALARAKARETGRVICVVPELKHPAYHRRLGLPLEEPLLAALARHGWNRAEAPVFVQSFEPASLRLLDARSDVRLVQLVGENGPDATALDAVAGYADAIGVWKPHLMRQEAGGAWRPTGLIAEAHARGLLVFAWTFRSEPRWLPAGRPDAELRAFYEAGVDGVFADAPDVAYAARTQFLLQERRP